MMHNQIGKRWLKSGFLSDFLVCTYLGYITPKKKLVFGNLTRGQENWYFFRVNHKQLKNQYVIVSDIDVSFL